MLSWLFRKLIEQYWKRVHESDRKVCIYKVSCSKHVYSSLSEHGFIKGLNEFIIRRKNCKPGYKITNFDGKISITTKIGLLLVEDEINPIIVKEARLVSNVSAISSSEYDHSI